MATNSVGEAIVYAGDMGNELMKRREQTLEQSAGAGMVA